MKEYYKKILETEFKGKTIFEQLGKNGLTVSKSYKGSEYDNCSEKIMIVGRAMNGWEDDRKFTSVDDFIDTFLYEFQNISETKNVFDDVVNRKGFESKGRKRNYLYINSKFWKLIHHILKEYGMANDNWYDDDNGGNMDWNKKIVWSNLYKVSPYAEGNPEWKLIKPNMQEYIDIIKAEIKQYNPNKIIFITDRWHLDPWVKQPKFSEALGIKFVEEPKNCIVGTGGYNGAKIIVCTRPDKRGMKNEDVATMAKEIKEALGE